MLRSGERKQNQKARPNFVMRRERKKCLLHKNI